MDLGEQATALGGVSPFSRKGTNRDISEGSGSIGLIKVTRSLLSCRWNEKSVAFDFQDSLLGAGWGQGQVKPCFAHCMQAVLIGALAPHGIPNITTSNPQTEQERAPEEQHVGVK